MIYTFPEGNAQMRSLLGGKGAGLAEMTNAGLPVPPGFTITTEACNAYYAAGKELPPGLWDDVLAHMAALEQETGKGFGDPKNPLLVSVRSGAAFSMPGMMDTVLNLGLNEHTVSGLIELTGNERFGYDAWRRFVAMFGRIVLDIPAAEFDEPFDALKQKRGVSLDTDLTADDLQGHRRQVPRDRAQARPASHSRPIPTGSWSWPSGRCSTRGSASAPTTTASSTRSRTTWARR